MKKDMDKRSEWGKDGIRVKSGVFTSKLDAPDTNVGGLLLSGQMEIPMKTRLESFRYSYVGRALNSIPGVSI